MKKQPMPRKKNERMWGTIQGDSAPIGSDGSDENKDERTNKRWNDDKRGPKKNTYEPSKWEPSKQNHWEGHVYDKKWLGIRGLISEWIGKLTISGR